MMCQVDIPLLLDHFDEVAVIDYFLKYRSKSESVVTTKGSRETNDRYGMTQFRWLDSSIRISYVGIEMRQKTAVSGSR
jgi:hypothetical protein